MRSHIRRLLIKAGNIISEPILHNQLEILERQRELFLAQRSNKEMQLLLSMRYKKMLLDKVPLPTFDEVEFRCFSQNGEDGILLYIFSLIGVTNKKAVEVCAGDGTECNTTNLIVNHGWTGLLFDGDKEEVKRGRAFYSKCRDTFLWPPTLVNEWITAENVDSLISMHGFEGDIDLLSLDMDGNDYWVWKSIDCISPRVVVLEYNNLLGPERSATIPYRPDFRAELGELGMDYGGASLTAFVKLGREKGYRLVGCQRYGFNAFFVRSDVGRDIFPEIPTSKCFEHPFAQHAMKTRFANIESMNWIDV